MIKLLIRNNLIFFILISALSSLAMAAPSGITFKIKISKPDGSTLEEPLVDFRISTLDSAGACVLYSETFGGVSMTGTGGSLIFELGSGAQVYSAASSFSEIFNNLTASYTCQTGGTTTPIATSGRKLVLQFNDGTGAGWQTVNPVDVKSVPYALHAGNAEKLAGHPASDFLQGSTNLSSITSASTARTNLGAGAIGSSIFTAATPAAARTTLGLGTSSVLDVGAAANNLVQLDGAAKIPAALLPSSATFWQDAGAGKINYSGGWVGLGTANPYGMLHLDTTDAQNQIFIINNNSTVARNPSLVIYNLDGAGLGGFPKISMRTGRGSVGAQLASQAGDIIGMLEFQANRGGVLTTPATMKAVVTETQTSSARGGALTFSTNANGTSTLLERMRIDHSGYVGIGTTGPTQVLDVVGNIKTSGCVYYASSSVGTCASDERIKKDVRAFDLGLREILKINPVNFKYNGLAGFQDDGKIQLGVIAQQLEEAAPSLVKRQMVQLHVGDHEKTEIKVVDYGAFTYVIINSIKEFYSKWFADSEVLHREIASIKVDNLEKDLEIKKLIEENEAIKIRLEQIEKAILNNN